MCSAPGVSTPHLPCCKSSASRGTPCLDSFPFVDPDRLDVVIAEYDPGPPHLCAVPQELHCSNRIEFWIVLVYLGLDKLVTVPTHGGTDGAAVSCSLLNVSIAKTENKNV